MTVSTLIACFAWSVSLGFLTCTNAAFQPPNGFPSPGARKTGGMSRDGQERAERRTDAAETIRD